MVSHSDRHKKRNWGNGRQPAKARCPAVAGSSRRRKSFSFGRVSAPGKFHRAVWRFLSTLVQGRRLVGQHLLKRISCAGSDRCIHGGFKNAGHAGRNHPLLRCIHSNRIGMPQCVKEPGGVQFRTCAIALPHRSSVQPHRAQEALRPVAEPPWHYVQAIPCPADSPLQDLPTPAAPCIWRQCAAFL